MFLHSIDIDALADCLVEQLFVPVEASGRHVHVTKEQALILFGHGLTPERPLSQPGQFLAKERVNVRGPKGEFHNVAVLGPERKEAQVEVSLTDGKVLGIVPPIRPSGDVSGSAGAVLTGPMGEVRLEQGVMAAQRHIHLSPDDAARFRVADKQIVRLRVFGSRPLVFEDVLVRVSPQFQTAAHLDYDEANACGFKKGCLGRILP